MKDSFSRREHIGWVDLLRVLACFLVVFAHCCDPFVGQLDADRGAFLTGAFAGSLVRCSVPLFVMMTGVLLLPVGEGWGPSTAGASAASCRRSCSGRWRCRCSSSPISTPSAPLRRARRSIRRRIPCASSSCASIRSSSTSTTTPRRCGISICSWGFTS